MSRRNIFQMIADNTDQEKETGRLDRLFSDDELIWYSDAVGRTIRQYVHEYCFFNWKNRGHCVDFEDYLDTLDYDGLLYDARTDVDAYLTLIELIMNMWKLVEQSLSTGDDRWKYSEGFCHLRDIMTEELGKNLPLVLVGGRQFKELGRFDSFGWSLLIFSSGFSS